VLVVGPKPAAVACLLVLPLAACGTGGRERDVAAVSESFHAALRSGDGKAACDAVSEETRSKLEQQEKKPCDQAILSLQIPKSATIAVRHVEITSAYIGLAGGNADFLDEGPEGWKISAAGCKPSSPGQPYDCELEG
jgi:hypothetical protein